MCRLLKWTTLLIKNLVIGGMKSDQKDSNKSSLIFRQSVPDYEKAELDLLRHALKRYYTERFDKMMHFITH